MNVSFLLGEVFLFLDLYDVKKRISSVWHTAWVVKTDEQPTCSSHFMFVRCRQLRIKLT